MTPARCAILEILLVLVLLRQQQFAFRHRVRALVLLLAHALVERHKLLAHFLLLGAKLGSLLLRFLLLLLEFHCKHLAPFSRLRELLLQPRDLRS